MTEPYTTAASGVSSERELKFRIPDAKSFERLLQSAAGGKPAVPVVQRNHIFDTPERALSQQGYRLRLREEAGRWVLTAKGPPLEDGGSADGALTRPEVESTVSAEEARALVEGSGSPLELLAKAAHLNAADRDWAVALARTHDQAPIEWLGGFVNERVRIPWRSPGADPVHCTFELDRTHFPGGRVDYELEVELPSGAPGAAVETAVRRWLEDAGIVPERSSGKVKRFFQALDNLPPVAPAGDRFS